MAAAGVALVGFLGPGVPGLAEHLDDCSVAHAALEG
ncbi:hypothetical protein FAGKG844_10051 [Frankia sp. AgKG'84/4]